MIAANEHTQMLHAVLATAAEPRPKHYIVHVEGHERGLIQRTNLRASAMRRAGSLPLEVDTIVRFEACGCARGEA